MKDIASFISGFRDFQKLYFCPEEDFFSGLKKEQHPKAMVVGCSDSRVDPALTLGCEPGDIFVVRNVANLIPPYETTPGQHGVSAALEYAVKILSVEHIIVMGHSSCGGIEALMSSGTGSMGEFITPWVAIAEDALTKVGRTLSGKEEHLRRRACEQAAILISLENLLSFPWIRARVDLGNLALHGWYFDIARGELSRYSPRNKAFQVMVSRCA